MEDDISGWCLFGIEVSIGVEVFEYFEDEITQLEGVILIEINEGDL
jgi:hypothetical protein